MLEERIQLKDKMMIMRWIMQSEGGLREGFVNVPMALHVDGWVLECVLVMHAAAWNRNE